MLVVKRVLCGAGRDEAVFVTPSQKSFSTCFSPFQVEKEKAFQRRCPFYLEVEKKFSTILYFGCRKKVSDDYLLTFFFTFEFEKKVFQTIFPLSKSKRKKFFEVSSSSEGQKDFKRGSFSSVQKRFFDVVFILEVEKKVNFEDPNEEAFYRRFYRFKLVIKIFSQERQKSTTAKTSINIKRRKTVLNYYYT